MKIKVKKLNKKAKIPCFAQAGDAGLDIFSVDNAVLKPGQKGLIKTGIAIGLPSGYVALVWDKSGPSLQHGIKTLGGVFDGNYTGEYIIGLINLGKKDFAIKRGQKIAQILFQKIEEPEIEEVKKLPKTNRGAGRCGSTGLY